MDEPEKPLQNITLAEYKAAILFSRIEAGESVIEAAKALNLSRGRASVLLNNYLPERRVEVIESARAMIESKLPKMLEDSLDLLSMTVNADVPGISLKTRLEAAKTILEFSKKYT